MTENPPQLTERARHSGEHDLRRALLRLVADEPGDAGDLARRHPGAQRLDVTYHMRVLEADGCAKTIAREERRRRLDPIYAVTPMGLALLASFDS